MNSLMLPHVGYQKALLHAVAVLVVAGSYKPTASASYSMSLSHKGGKATGPTLFNVSGKDVALTMHPMSEEYYKRDSYPARRLEPPSTLQDACRRHSHVYPRLRY